MKANINRIWRIFATGFAFAFFGFGALFLSLFCFPILRLLYSDEKTLKRHTQRTVHHVFRFFFGMLKTLGLLDLQIAGETRLRNLHGTLIIANHPTLLDYVLFVALMPEVDCVVKPALLKNFFLRGVVRASRYIPTTDDHTWIDACTTRLQAGCNVILFPEGTRSNADGLKPFRRSAARIAGASGAPILPIVLTCQPPTLMKGQPWYEIPAKKPVLALRICDAIWPTSMPEEAANPWIFARKFTRYLETFYATELRNAKSSAAASTS